ncbi:MAG: hypothetical protein AAFX81_18175 [Pseudomonadota bacterium]
MLVAAFGLGVTPTVPLADRRVVVFHDAYRYFEARFGMEAAGVISLGGTEPGPHRGDPRHHRPARPSLSTSACASA